MTFQSPRYNVLLVSVDRVAGGHDGAAAAIASRFSLSERVARRLVAAVPAPVKKDVELAVAVRYVEALEQLGAHAQLVASDATSADVPRGPSRRGDREPRGAAGVAQSSGSHLPVPSNQPPPTAPADDEEDLLAVSSAPLVTELSDPAIDIADATQVLDPARLARAGVSLEDHAARLVDAGAEYAELRRATEPANAPLQQAVDPGFSSDLAAFVDVEEQEEPAAVPEAIRRPSGDVGIVADAEGANAFELPPQVTGQHRAVPKRSEELEGDAGASVGQFLGDFQGELADAAPVDSVDTLGQELGVAGRGRPSLFDELQALHDEEDDGVGASISSEPPGAVRGSDVPLADPAIGLEAGALPGLSTRDTLEDELMQLTDSYRAIEPAGAYEDPEMDEPDDVMAERAVSPRPASPGPGQAALGTGSQRATTPSGTYITSTGSFTPAPRRPVWVKAVLGLLVAVAIGCAGYVGYEAWRARQPDEVFANAGSYYEFEETIGGEQARYICAGVGRRKFLCRYGRGFYRAQFPDASGPALEAAVTGCYAELTSSGLGVSENLTCRLNVDRGSESQRHEFSYLRDVDCGESLLRLQEGASTTCVTRITLSHHVDGAEVRQGEMGGTELYQLRRAIPLETEVGFLDAYEFVVTRENASTLRAFFYEPLALFVRRRGFAGEALLDIKYMDDRDRQGGSSEMLSP